MAGKVIIVILLMAATNYAYRRKQVDEGTINVYRDKRQEKPWVWGENGNQQFDNNTLDTRQQDTSTTTPAPDGPSPCDPYKPQKPDFSQGRRISKAKCFEYLWEMKNREDEIKRNDACTLEKAKKNSAIAAVKYVINGRYTVPGEFPHMGALGWRAVVGTWIFKCGSTLISHKFLVTAAHCSKVSSIDTSVSNTRPEIVRLGVENILDNYYGKDVKILRFIVHPQYDPPKRYFDIGLIEMEKEVPFDRYLQPACLWSSHDTSPLGNNASLSGWGVVDAGSQKTSPRLLAAYVEIVDSDLCNELLTPVFNRHFWGIQPHQLCAGVLAGGTDSCQGDSGGPLQVKIKVPVTTQGSMSYLIGVTSFGFGCARANTPGVYTRVSSFVDWIESIVWT